jgi:hypothetical protein
MHSSMIDKADEQIGLPSCSWRVSDKGRIKVTVRNGHQRLNVEHCYTMEKKRKPIRLPDASEYLLSSRML